MAKLDSKSTETRLNRKRRNRKFTLIPHKHLIRDCWDEILDFLDIEQIFKVSETCKDLRQICGTYLSRYPSIACTLKNHHYFQYGTFKININYSQYIRKLRIDDCCTLDSRTMRILSTYTKRQLHKLFTIDKFCMLETVMFDSITLRPRDFDGLENLKNHLQTVEMHKSTIPDAAWEQFNFHFSELTTMNLRKCSNAAAFFRLEWPQLENLTFLPENPSELRINELDLFFEKHSTLCHFHSAGGILLKNQECFKNSTLTLRSLTVCLNEFPEKFGFAEIARLLKLLYLRGLFKCLNLSFNYMSYYFDRDDLGSVEMIELCKTVPIKQFSVVNVFFPNLRSRCLFPFLKNVEEIVVDVFSAKHMPHIASQLKTLKTVTIHREIGEANGIHNVDLSALNKARQTANPSSPISLYLDEGNYMWIKKHKNNLHLLSHLKIYRHFKLKK